MSSGALSVNNSLWNTLTSEMSKLVEEVEVLSEDRTSWASSHRVLVVIDGVTTGSSDGGTLSHLIS